MKPVTQIVEVTTHNQLKAFVKFPFRLYKNNPYWVPPLIQDEMDFFNSEKNPSYKEAEVQLFMAVRGKKVVGRIALIINKKEVEQLQLKKLRFGWFDFIDDQEVSKMLLDKAFEIGKEKGMDHLEGPMGFTNMDKVGVLTEGYEELSTMITWYNFPYYVQHFEKMHFEKAKEWLEFYFYTKDIAYDQYENMSERIQKRYQLKLVSFKSSREIMPYANKIFDLLDVTYSKLASYVPLTSEQVEYFKNKYIPLIDPDFIKIVENEDGETIAFAITMPSYAKALLKAKGKMWPFGFIHFLKARKNTKEVLFYLIGIHPDYQKKGVIFMLFDAYAKAYNKRGIEKAIRTPELADNKDIQRLWKAFNPVNHKKRCTYRKSIT